jgi:hypothetical protein
MTFRRLAVVITPKQIARLHEVVGWRIKYFRFEHTPYPNRWFVYVASH